MATPTPGAVGEPESTFGPIDLRARVPAQALMELVLRMRLDGQPDAEIASWHSGAIGERHVGDILSRLGSEWTVLHSVPFGDNGTDIDHVVIGPPGAFTLNTKRHPGGTVWVAGRSLQVAGQYQPYIPKAAGEARRAEELLSAASGIQVETSGLIVVVAARHVTVRERPDGGDIVVDVVRDHDLLAAFMRAGRRYSDEQVARIAAAAARPETWSRLPLEAVDAHSLISNFEAISLSPPERRPSKATSPRPAAKAMPSVLRTQRAPRSTRPSNRRTRRKRKSALPDLFKFALAVTLLIVGLNYVNNLAKPAAEEQAFATADQEQAALAQYAGAASLGIERASAGGTRPASLALGTGSELQLPDGSVLVDLPDGTEADYAPSADGLSYSLTLTGAQYGSTVTLTPETGVVANHEAAG
ncbi:nuclease-related domain-containing protein [Leifsonia sp. Root60]|uniref:nuclease-related domain-containing protein n=2 Tax=unclassified Leifsonia TaxID=2663824 RepID=UPI001F3B70F0|nr:nuclease-related domain-containing protein [Leifsonia sp. Root60]